MKIQDNNGTIYEVSEKRWSDLQRKQGRNPTLRPVKLPPKEVKVKVEKRLAPNTNTEI